MPYTEINAFTDAQLRIIYALIRAIVCNDADEIKEFDADNAYSFSIGFGGIKRKSVAFTMMAMGDLRNSYTTTKTNVFDADGFNATLKGILSAV